MFDILKNKSDSWQYEDRFRARDEGILGLTISKLRRNQIQLDAVAGLD